MKQDKPNAFPSPLGSGLGSQVLTGCTNGIGLRETGSYDLKYANHDLILANFRLSKDERQVLVHACDPDGWWDDLLVSLGPDGAPEIQGNPIGAMSHPLKARIGYIVCNLMVSRIRLPEAIVVSQRGPAFSMKVPLWPSRIASKEASRMLIGFIVSRDSCGPHAEFHLARQGLGFLPFRVHYSLGRLQRAGVYYENRDIRYVRPKPLERRLERTTEMLLEQHQMGLLSHAAVLTQDGSAPPIEPRYATLDIPMSAEPLAHPTLKL